MTQSPGFRPGLFRCSIAVVRRLRSPAVMLVPVDAVGRAVLLPVHNLPVSSRQLSTVGFPHSVYFAVYALLLTFQAGRFACCQLAAVDALRDAGLLITFASVYGAWCLSKSGWNGKRDQGRTGG